MEKEYLILLVTFAVVHGGAKQPESDTSCCANFQNLKNKLEKDFASFKLSVKDSLNQYFDTVCKDQSKKTCCRISGDLHINTFIGADMHHQGAPCEYSLGSGSCDGELFYVHAMNEHRQGRTDVASLKYLKVIYKGNMVQVDKNKIIKVNDALVDSASLPYNLPGVSVTDESSRITVTLSNQAVIQYDGNQKASVCVPSACLLYEASICGTGIPNEDDTSNSWNVNPSCVNTKGKSQTCSSSDVNNAQSNIYCGLLIDKDGSFSICLTSKVNGNGLFRECTEAVCAVAGDDALMRTRACNSLKKMVDRCQEVGLGIRNLKFAAKCDCGVALLKGKNNECARPMSASSEYDINNTARQSCLHATGAAGGGGAWCAIENNQHQWIEVDFSVRTFVTGIATQGRSSVSEWLLEYVIQYSDDKLSWANYNQENTNHTFTGNVDQNTVVKHDVQPFAARFVRLVPVTWNGWICLRWEVYGCPFQQT